MRIAYFSPLTPQRSGIADYSEALLPRLAAHFEIDVFIEDYTPANTGLERFARIRHWREFESDYASGAYGNVLYQIGNNPQHVYIYDAALRTPGVVMLHEFNLHYLLAAATISRSDWNAYFLELEYNAGSGALPHAERVRRGETEPEYARVPMNRRLLENSRAAIVHSEYMARLVRAAGFTLPLARIPHGVEPAQVDPSTARAELGLNGGRLVGAFGFLKPYKRIHSAIEAVGKLVRDFPDTRLLLVGEEHPHYPLRPLISRLGLERQVEIPGFVPLEDFAKYIAACDVCLNLRYPTVGESSGSLLREMALGKAVLVSDIGAFSELPGDACVKIPPGDGEVTWISEYLAALLQAPELREGLGSNARRWAIEECSWTKAAGRYAEFLTRSDSEAVPSSAGAPEAPRPPGPAPAGNGLHLSSSGLPDRKVLADYILSFGAADRAMEDYTRLHLNRLVHTLEITPAGPPESGTRILEMGCYFQITPALGRFLGYTDVRGCYYGPSGGAEYKSAYSSTGETFSCWVDLFDAEKDAFPYSDNSFDTVLCCELIEHLYHDPMHMMSEINRILKPGGRLVLSTPNIIGLRGLHALLHGFHPGLFHTYVVPKPNGVVDPRHNREYAPRDIRALFENSGLAVERLETGWIAEEDAARYAQADELMAASGYSRDLRGDLIYAVGRKTGPVRHRYPAELYTTF